MNTKGQMTIIIIIALVITAGIMVFFLVRDKIEISDIPADFARVYNYYSSCIEEASREAVDIAGSQGGRIYDLPYSSGNVYAPFSSHLNFLGFNVPYWYYVSGNGIIKEQVPNKRDMEQEISRYVNEKIKECDFEEFYQQGFSISFSDSNVNLKVNENNIEVDVNQEMIVSREDESARKSDHKISFESKIGKFYGIAKRIYDKEKRDAFLEEYSVDVLRLYAPVDGVEISCSPKIWRTREVADDLQKGLESNIGKLKLKGNYYSLKDKKNEYFVVNEESDEAVNFVYSKDWPYKIEIDGAEDELLIANPIGNQEGLGIMGFCYAPYHFVYDISFPVMVQIYDVNEIFQFPVAVIIDNNVAREAVFSEVNYEEDIDVCEFNTQDIEVNVYDVNLNKVDANISYGCFDQKCNLGESKDGRFIGKAPACLNGYILAKSEGYVEKKELFSSNEEGSADVILDKEYELDLNLSVDGRKIEGSAIVNFDGPQIKSVSFPEISKVKLGEGLYNISVFIYGNSSVVIPASIKTQCTEVSRGGIYGLFGGTKEECFDINIPESKIEYALIGGGRTTEYLLPDDLEKGTLKIKAKEFSKPNSLEQLQYNYEIFERSGIDLEF